MRRRSFSIYAETEEEFLNLADNFSTLSSDKDENYLEHLEDLDEKKNDENQILSLLCDSIRELNFSSSSLRNCRKFRVKLNSINSQNDVYDFDLENYISRFSGVVQDEKIKCMVISNSSAMKNIFLGIQPEAQSNYALDISKKDFNLWDKNLVVQCFNTEEPFFKNDICNAFLSVCDCIFVLVDFEVLDNFLVSPTIKKLNKISSKKTIIFITKKDNDKIKTLDLGFNYIQISLNKIRFDENNKLFRNVLSLVLVRKINSKSSTALNNSNEVHEQSTSDSSHNLSYNAKYELNLKEAFDFEKVIYKKSHEI